MKAHQKNISPKSEATWFLVLMLISIVIIGLHAYLNSQHYQLKLGLSDGKSVCNVSSTFNCDTVSISRYATFFGTGIPMALLGLLSQVVFFILLITARFQLSSGSSSIRRSLFWFSLFSAGISILMGLFSSLALGTYCLFCMAVYVLSFIQLFGSWKIQNSSPKAHLVDDLAGFFQVHRWVPTLLILIPFVGYMIHSMTLNSYGIKKMDLFINDALAGWEAAPVQNFNPSLGLSLGQESAKLTIVEFADFLCPHCKTASPSLEAFTQSHPDVRMVFKVFALDGKCNKVITQEGDGVRCRLGAAALCSQELAQKGWQAQHYIFENQESLARSFEVSTFLDQISQELQMDKAALEKCMNSDSTQEKLMAMGQEGENAKIQGTPSIFVNGKRLDRGQFLPVLEALHRKLNP